MAILTCSETMTETRVSGTWTITEQSVKYLTIPSNISIISFQNRFNVRGGRGWGDVAPKCGWLRSTHGIRGLPDIRMMRFVLGHDLCGATHRPENEYHHYNLQSSVHNVLGSPWERDGEGGPFLKEMLSSTGFQMVLRLVHKLQFGNAFP